MSKQEYIQEGVVIRLVAADECMTISEASDFWKGWKKELERQPKHSGDCIKEPEACNRCLIEDYYRQADEILTFEDSQGVVIKGDQALPTATMTLVGGDNNALKIINYLLGNDYVAVEPLIKLG